MVKVIGVLLLAVVSIFVLSLFQSSEIHISKDIEIISPVSRVFPWINTPEKTVEWLDWKTKDPYIKIDYSGPAQGINAAMEWQSAGVLGTGKAVIVDSLTNRFVKTELTYTRPSNLKEISEFHVREEGEHTLVRWDIRGRKPYAMQVMGVFKNVDAPIEVMVSEGLKNLKATLEKGWAASSRP